MAGTERQEKVKVVMILSPAAQILARLIRVAAEQLEEEGFGIITSVDVLVKKDQTINKVLLVESGYEVSCREIVEEKQIKVDHHLILKDLGFEEDAELTTDNIELIKDGMVAECVVVESQAPKFNCPCGFSG